MKSTCKPAFAALRRGRQNPLAIALISALVFTTTTQAQIPLAPDSRVTLSSPLQGNEDLTYGAVTESPGGEPDASELNRQLTNPVSSLWSIESQFNNFELNNGQWNNNWNFQPVLPVSLTKDWNLITRPVMPFYNIVPHETCSQRIRAGRRAGRCGSAGIAVSCALGQLDSWSRTYRHLPDRDIDVHRPGQIPAWTHCCGRLPNEAVLHWRVSPAMVVHRRAAWPARHEPDEPATHRDRSSSARAGASGTPAISWRTGTRRLTTSGRSPSGSAWVRCEVWASAR